MEIGDAPTPIVSRDFIVLSGVVVEIAEVVTCPEKKLVLDVDPVWDVDFPREVIGT
jgi:hypothetical protein